MTLPSAETNYQATPDMDINRATWDGVMLSIGTRLSALEATGADYDADVAKLQTQALAVITATITDEINAQRVNLDQLEAGYGVFEAQFNALMAGGVAAKKVTLEAIAGLTATDVQAAFEEALTKIPAKATPEEVLAGEDDTKFITPSTLKQSGAGGVTQAALMVAGVI